MLRQQVKMFRFLAAILDLVIVAFSYFFADHLKPLVGADPGNRSHTWVLFLILPVWYILFHYFNLYSSMRVRSISSVLYSILKAHVTGAILVSSSIYFFHIRNYTRDVLVIFLFISFVLVCMEKVIVKTSLLFLRRRGYNYRNILLISNDTQARRVVEIIEDHADWGLNIIGVLDSGGAPGKYGGKYPVLGGVRDIAEVCMKYPVDEAIFCLTKEHAWLVDEYRTLLKNMGITVRMVLDNLTSVPDKSELSCLHKEVLMLTYYAGTFDSRSAFCKRSLDIAGSIVGLLLTAFLFPFLAIAIKVDSPGPVFFRQKRVGRNGRVFIIRKFRSMYRDAEERKSELLSLNEMKGALFKIKNDPRVTRVGAILRRTSMDELPQFWNVLMGEMSLVGTRPPTPEEVEGYAYEHRKRICIKPGMTGLWQVSGRNEIRRFDDVVRLDIEYIDKWTLWMDMRILLKTVQIIFTGRGAC